MSARAVVIGSGVNELVAAHLLARAGHPVVLVPEGFSAEICGWIAPRIVRELDLQRHGLQVEQDDPWATAPLSGGGRLELWQDLSRSVDSIRRLSENDAARWPEFCERMARLARFLEKSYTRAPESPLNLGFAWRARRLGRQGLTDLMRVLPMPAADLLDDWFESDALKGALGAAAIMRLPQGPRSGGTAFRLLHQQVGSPAGVFRPPRSNLQKVLFALPGIEILRAKAVSRIAVQAGCVASVVLADGEEIAASLVVSGASVRRTLVDLVDSGWLDPELVRAVRNIRHRSVAARMSLQLDRAPGFSTLVLAPSLDYLERAYDHLKYGRISAQPFLEARCSPDNCIEVNVQFVPPAARDAGALAGAVMQLLSPHLGGAAVTQQEMLLPRDLEAPAELSLDQALWMRPIPQLARYRTPIGGLWLCGASMHPGDGIAGAAGYNCAGEILRSR